MGLSYGHEFYRRHTSDDTQPIDRMLVLGARSRLLCFVNGSYPDMKYCPQRTDEHTNYSTSKIKW